MIRMLLEPEAEREFQEAQVWYEKRNVALATMFREAVRETLWAVVIAIIHGRRNPIRWQARR